MASYWVLPRANGLIAKKLDFEFSLPGVATYYQLVFIENGTHLYFGQTNAAATADTPETRLTAIEFSTYLEKQQLL